MESAALSLWKPKMAFCQLVHTCGKWYNPANPWFNPKTARKSLTSTCRSQTLKVDLENCKLSDKRSWTSSTTPSSKELAWTPLWSPTQLATAPVAQTPSAKCAALRCSWRTRTGLRVTTAGNKSTKPTWPRSASTNRLLLPTCPWTSLVLKLDSIAKRTQWARPWDSSRLVLLLSQLTS